MVANFVVPTPQNTVTLSSNPLIGGTTSGGGFFNAGASVTVSAVANAGYTFTNWTEGIVLLSTNSNYTFTINSNRVLIANFTAGVLPPSGPLAIDLGCSAPFSVLAGSTITSTGPTIINGDVGLSPGSAIIGFPPGIINGTQQITTPAAAAAKLCLDFSIFGWSGQIIECDFLTRTTGWTHSGSRTLLKLYLRVEYQDGANGILTWMQEVMLMPFGFSKSARHYNRIGNEYCTAGGAKAG